MNYKLSIITLILIACCSGSDRPEGPCSPIGSHALTFEYLEDNCTTDKGELQHYVVRVTQSADEYTMQLGDGEPLPAFFLQDDCALIVSEEGVELELDFSGDSIEGYGAFDFVCLEEFTVTED